MSICEQNDRGDGSRSALIALCTSYMKGAADTQSSIDINNELLDDLSRTWLTRWKNAERIKGATNQVEHFENRLQEIEKNIALLCGEKNR